MTVVLPGPVTAADVTAAAAAVPLVTLFLPLGSSGTQIQWMCAKDKSTVKMLMWNATSDVLRFELVNAERLLIRMNPDVVSIVRAVTAAGRVNQGTAESIFGGNPVNGPFDVKVTFTEEPKL